MTDLLATLQAFHQEKLAALLRHQQHAQLIGGYDANNTYQYIINREETELSWLAAAVAELGGTVAIQADLPNPVSVRGTDQARPLFEEDARDAQAFVDRWRPRVDQMPNARHAKMLRLILGEVLEQKRFFDQALAGRTDLLGRRGQQLGPAKGEVLSSRWIE